jgi:hypothetical protein
VIFKGNFRKFRGSGCRGCSRDRAKERRIRQIAMSACRCCVLGDCVIAYVNAALSHILYFMQCHCVWVHAHHTCCVCMRTRTSTHSVCAVNNTNSIIFRGSIYLLPMGDLSRHRTQSSLLSVGALNRHQDCMPVTSVGALTRQDNFPCR